MRTNTKTHTDSSSGIQRSKLEKLFEEELKDMYWAEKALTKAIPKMIKKSTSEELAKALQDHLAQTEEHVSRLEEVFHILEKEPKEKKCEAMHGLIKEAEQIINESEEGVMRDAGIISAAQKVEHYEIASYGTLRTFANTLGIQDAANVLQRTLDEEKAADDKLSEIAESEINIEASEE
ncbi:MAG TPA: ferritin-like domain-containing protein [Cyclobacteriaceae bacterium]